MATRSARTNWAATTWCAPRDVKTANAHDVIAYGGFWNMGDTAHITTIATHPQWRRRHLAVWLMLHMMDRHAAPSIDIITLEVRAGNGAAQQLYHSLGFAEVEWCAAVTIRRPRRGRLKTRF
ncbi:MAG: GNAT family N-acetyltransferase [Anaerolineae bacterium]|nr:GNAT family N-acetyltransferase [Anaerolineae bacterium]